MLYHVRFRVTISRLIVIIRTTKRRGSSSSNRSKWRVGKEVAAVARVIATATVKTKDSHRSLTV
jgi:hypothetical protein